jgi:arylsulfatase A-like enzyme
LIDLKGYRMRSAIRAMLPLIVAGVSTTMMIETAHAAARRPNLVFLLADQLRYQSVGYAGDTKARTPHLDRLASEGVSFRSFVASTPVCAAYRASLFTGKYASSTGMVVNELRINPNQDCLAHVLNAQGYKTGYIGKWHLWAKEAGQHLAIRNAYTPPGPFRLGFNGFWAAYNFNHSNFRAWYFRDTPEPHRIEGFGPDRFTDMAIDFIKERSKAEQPFALIVSFSTPHDPWTNDNVPQAWYDKFKNVAFDYPATWKETPDPRMDRNTDPELWTKRWKAHLEDYQRVYYAMTANLDYNVGRVVKAINEAGIDGNTIVVFTSDHGEMFGAHGRIFKMTFYDEAARVPMLIRRPGTIPAGHVSDACMATPDIMPTLLGLMGLDAPPQIEGMDLSHLAKGKPGPEPEFAFLQGMGHTFQWKDGFEWRAIRDKRYTYAVYRSDGKELLFDNIADPRQSRDFAGDPESHEKLIRLRAKLKMKMTELNDPFEACSWYRDHWTKDRQILRGAKGDFRRELGPNVLVESD